MRSDRELRFPDFTVVNASAGTGKTTALARRIAQFLLSDRIAGNDLGRILAMTFTRNAAAEMKARVLELLKRAALGDAETLSTLASLVAADPAVLSERAAHMLATILDRYGEFRVQTIDSFLGRLFRASALEFGFGPDCEIDVAGDRLLDDALDALADEIAADLAVARLFERAADLVQAERSHGTVAWNPYATLADRVRETFTALRARTGRVSVEDASAAYDAAEARCNAAFAAVRACIDEHGWPWTVRAAEYFSARGAPAFSALLRRRFPSQPLKKSEMKGAYDNAMATVAPLVREAGAALDDWLVARAFRRAQPLATLVAWLDGAMRRVMLRGNRVSLQELVRLVHGWVRDADIPSVYVRVGERVAHYLVDEFQDTSPVQWESVRPLLEEALAQGGSAFVVGDPKQSIYGFRAADWRIMRGLGADTFPSAHFTPESLEINYRSGGRILAFCREVFAVRVPATEHAAAAAASGLDSALERSVPGREQDGFVTVTKIRRHPETRPDLAAVVGRVRECLERGWRNADVTVLAPRNVDVVEVGAALHTAGIPFLSHSTLDARRRGPVGELLALLAFLDAPVDDLAFASFALGNLLPAASRVAGVPVDPAAVRTALAPDPDSDEYLYKRFAAAHPAVWERLFAHLLAAAGYVPVYDLLCDACAAFRVFDAQPSHEAAVTQLLDAAAAAESAGITGIAAFLDAARDEADAEIWNLAPPGGLDAVRVMTVHKSKGLSAPVVVALLPDERQERTPLCDDGDGEVIRLLDVSKDMAAHSPRLANVRAAALEARRTDALNALYVAITRAAGELHVVSAYTETKDGEPRPPSMYFPDDGFRLGEPRGASAADSASPPPNARLVHVVAPLAPVTARGAYVSTREMRRGECVHAALERIEYCDPAGAEATAGAAVRDLEADGIDTAEFPDLRDSIAGFLASSAGTAIFAPVAGRAVLRERAIVDARGALFRMDRVLVDPERVRVLDFKTGGEERADEYAAQVRRYMDLLAHVYPDRAVEGAIAYVDGRLVREVSA